MAVLLVITIGLTACVTRPVIVSPAADRLAPWTASLSAQQPDDPFVSVYRIGARHLVFIGAVHENRVDSGTFRLIGRAFDHYRFGRVIVEGYPTSRGANPDRLLKEAAEPATPDGFQPSGEAVPAERGAIAQNAQIWGGEPDDLDVKAFALRRGITEADLLGFYVLRMVPQWLREREIASPADSRLAGLVDKEMTRQRMSLAMAPTVLPDPGAWQRWYRTIQGRALDGRFSTEEVGPRVDGSFATNRIASIVAEARDAHLHRLMIRQLNEGASVLVVYGGSHLMIHRPALASAIGKPCYEGGDLTRSVSACR